MPFESLNVSKHSSESAILLTVSSWTWRLIFSTGVLIVALTVLPSFMGSVML